MIAKTVLRLYVFEAEHCEATTPLKDKLTAEGKFDSASDAWAWAKKLLIFSGSWKVVMRCGRKSEERRFTVSRSV